ncbi:hypothetical protein [Nocardia sp. SC052]|uniref:hypothetical protein n=1 Tax=Nocardia sichangensis TaxID=3385975 RepID=UPI0039A2E5A7
MSSNAIRIDPDSYGAMLGLKVECQSGTGSAMYYRVDHTSLHIYGIAISLQRLKYLSSKPETGGQRFTIGGIADQEIGILQQEVGLVRCKSGICHISLAYRYFDCDYFGGALGALESRSVSQRRRLKLESQVLNATKTQERNYRFTRIHLPGLCEF